MFRAPLREVREALLPGHGPAVPARLRHSAPPRGFGTAGAGRVTKRQATPSGVQGQKREASRGKAARDATRPERTALPALSCLGLSSEVTPKSLIPGAPWPSAPTRANNFEGEVGRLIIHRRENIKATCLKRASCWGRRGKRRGRAAGTGTAWRGEAEAARETRRRGGAGRGQTIYKYTSRQNDLPRPAGPAGSRSQGR